MNKVGSFIRKATLLPFELAWKGLKALNAGVALATEKFVIKDHERAQKAAPLITGGIAATVTAGTFAVMAYNAITEAGNYEQQREAGKQFPILSLAIGKSTGTDSHVIYYEGKSVNKALSEREALYDCDLNEGARCHIVATTNAYVPDCFKMTVTSKSYGDYPRLDLTPLYNDAGVRNDKPLGLTCIRDTISNEWSASCAPAETYICNNEGLLEDIIAQMNAAPRSEPN